MARKNNFPTGDLQELPKEYTKEMVSNLLSLYKKGKPPDDEGVRQRLEEYFTFCDASSVRPGVETMKLALCVSRQTLCNWENGIGCSKERQEMIIQAKAFVTSFLEQLMLHNKIFPGSGIFFLKNWADYRDNVTVSTDSNGYNNIPQMTREEIRQRHQQHKQLPEKPDLD